MAPSSLEQMQQSLARVLRQQAALAAFGSFAFRETNLHAILNEAAHVCAVASVSVVPRSASIARCRTISSSLPASAGMKAS